MTIPTSDPVVPSVHEDPVCKTCGNSKSWHATNPVRHDFNDGSTPVSDTFGKRTGERPKGGRNETTPQPPQLVSRGWPIDPVLRQALVDKGTLTIEDLRAAEEKIVTLTGHVLGDIPEGE